MEGTSALGTLGLSEVELVRWMTTTSGKESPATEENGIETEVHMEELQRKPHQLPQKCRTPCQRRLKRCGWARKWIVL